MVGLFGAAALLSGCAVLTWGRKTRGPAVVDTVVATLAAAGTVSVGAECVRTPLGDCRVVGTTQATAAVLLALAGAAVAFTVSAVVGFEGSRWKPPEGRSGRFCLLDSDCPAARRCAFQGSGRLIRGGTCESL